LAFKIAAVPFHFYAADVYEGAASPVTGLLGFVPKLAGFLALCKLLAAFDWNLPIELKWVLWAMAATTMTVGNVLALLQKNVKRMLGYSSIAHTGYMLIALLAGPVAGQGPLRDGVAALLFYIAVYGVMNLGAFAFLTAFSAAGRDVETLDDLAGIARRAPAATLGLAVCVFSLMGFPPTVGKLYLFSSAFAARPSHPMHGALIVLVIIGVVNTAIAAAYYLRIVAAAYMGSEVEGVVPASGRPVRWGLAVCSLSLLFLFVMPTGLTEQARSATVVLRRSIVTDAASLTTLPIPLDQPVTEAKAASTASIATTTDVELRD
jgi:NADH-quinone oxidoreductase subunit N